MTYFAYNSVLMAAAPLARAWLWSRSEHRGLLARFHPPARAFAVPPLWIHACSVGEVNAAAPLAAALRARFPEIPVLVTASTAAGHAQAEARFGADAAWCPFDTRGAVRRFLKAVRPRALVLIETEIWPNLLRESRRAGIPVILANGRLSTRHFNRYLRFERWFRPVFAQISHAAMQDARGAERLAALGVAPSRIAVTGNTKFDGAPAHASADSRARLRRQNGFPPHQPILLFGSTRPGDEALASACWATLREELPELRLIVAPRHLNRIDEALAPFDEAVIRRSEIKSGRAPQGERVFVLDTLGELQGFYSIATVAVIGGSFYPGPGGHNPLEPAALGIPTVFGPHMENFADVARALLQARGAVQASCPEELYPALSRLLADTNARRTLGTRARQAVLDNQGATRRTVDIIAASLGDSAGGVGASPGAA